MTPPETQNLITTAESADGANVRISLAGQCITNSEAPSTGIASGSA